MRAAPASAIQRALALWWSADACGYGISTDGQAVLGELEDRAARAGDGDVGGRQRDPERRQVVEQDVVRAGAGELGVVARAGDVDDAVGRVLERLGRGGVDRARAERAAEDEHARLVFADARVALGPGRGR